MVRRNLHDDKNIILSSSKGPLTPILALGGEREIRAALFLRRPGYPHQTLFSARIVAAVLSGLPSGESGLKISVEIFLQLY
jgi:hypothetical protein